MRNDALFTTAVLGNFAKSFAVINKKNYVFNATFANADGYITSFQKDAILDLKIEDVVYTPFYSGYIVVDNREDAIERFKSTPTKNEFTNSVAPNLVGYRTRGDARDLLFLSIIPVPSQDPKIKNPYDSSNLQYNKIFSFQCVFALTDETDIETSTGKAKKYKIVDLDYVVLKEKKIFFSTVNLLPGKNAAFLSDLNRRALTGDCLKYILQKGLGSTGAVFSTLSGNNTVTPNFESGASKIFYSSPNDYTAFDDLMYIYNFHVTSDPANDFSFLLKDGYTGEYTLESASSIFKKSYLKKGDIGGEYYIENLTIAGTKQYRI